MSSTDPEPALATTKRKFHKLLDNLIASTSTTSLASTLHESNTSTTSLAGHRTPEPASKRFRLSDVSMEKSRSVSGDRVKALQEKLFTPRRSIGKATGVGLRTVDANTLVKPSTPRKAPNFQPYSQEQFLGRLKTFADVKKWTNKPDLIGDVQWAKRGWICASWNTVACRGGCEQRVVVKLRPKRKDANGADIDLSEDLAVETEEGLVEKYQELIVDGHHEDCLWRKRGCTGRLLHITPVHMWRRFADMHIDEIYHIPIPNRAKSSAELLERYSSFIAIGKDLPISENLIYPEPSISEVLKRTPSTFFNSPGSTTSHEAPTSPLEISAFVFALFGWSGVSDAKIALATCNHCFQRIGLWLYKEDRLQEMGQKLEVPLESLRLNLLESHREHCPWKNPVTQGNPKDGPIRDMAAWQTLEFLLMGKKKKEDIKAVENIDLESYRGSIDSEHPSTSTGDKSRESDSLNEKWRRFKAKLRRTTSRRSMKSVKSAKSFKSANSVAEKDKENDRSTAA